MSVRLRPEVQKLQIMKTYKVTVDEDKTIRWYNSNGQRHREDGPAIEWANGTKSWYINGEYHREDGPAYEGANGTKYWYINGNCHREDGPAIEWADGSKTWYINGERLTEAEFNARTKSCSGRVIEIDGKKYKLTEIK
jgi:hypothetical protein